MKLNIIIDILLVAIIWITAIKGYKKGLVKTIYALVAFIVAAVITTLFYEQVAEYMMSLPFVQEMIVKLNQNIAETIISNTNINMFMPVWMGETVMGAVQTAGITAAGKLVEIIIMIATVLVTFFLSKLLLGLVAGVLDAVMKFPILDTVNKTGGLLAGLIKGVLIVLVCFGVISMFVTAEKYQYIHNLVNETYIAKYFYNNNILMRMIMK